MRFMLIFGAAVVCAIESAADAEYPVICYWESWSVYRPSPYTGNVSALPVGKCNHIIYAFLGLDESTNMLRYLDPWQDIDSEGITKFVALKEVKPDLKVSFAIGGWEEGSKSYSKMASTANGRETFAASVASVIEKHGFDGVDLDWEYPGARDGDPAIDKGNFVLLLQAMRTAIGEDRLLTVAVSANNNAIDVSYDVVEMSKVVNYIHVMTYDLRGPWDPTVGNHVLLHKRKLDPDSLAWINVAGGMAAWESRGAPPSKLVMGFAFYGKSFTLADPANTDIGAPATGPGKKGPVSQTPGTLLYFEICALLRTDDDWTNAWDNEGEVPYAYKGDQWIGYDDEESIRRKVNLIKLSGYGGAMVWTVNQDDSPGLCDVGMKYPLLTTISAELNGNGGDEGGKATTSSSSTILDITPDPDTTSTFKPSTARVSTSPDAPFTISAVPFSTPSSIAATTCAADADKKTSPAAWPPRCEKHTYPHTTSCRKFLVCDDAGLVRMIELNCPDGLVFNEDEGVCDWNFNTHPAPADCPDFL